MKNYQLLALIVIYSLMPGILNAQQDMPNKSEHEKPEQMIKHETATFAGGCFWCMQKPFDELSGVISTTSGYTGGQKHKPTY